MSSRYQSQVDASIACPGARDWERPHFGLASASFYGRTGFVDFLYSLTDNPFLYRRDNATNGTNLTAASAGSSIGEGSLLQTDDFIDTLTSAVRVIMVFYTPEYGITTTCIIDAAFHGSQVKGPAWSVKEPYINRENVLYHPRKIHVCRCRERSITLKTDVLAFALVSSNHLNPLITLWRRAQSAEVTFELLHYEILEGHHLNLYILVQSLVVFNLLAMLLEAVGSFKSIHKEARMGIPIPMQNFFVPLVDVLAAVLVLVYVVLRLPEKVASASKASSILSDLDRLEWASPDIALAQKKTTFLTIVDKLLALCFRESAINILCNVILLINLFRVIQVCADYSCS